MASWSVAAEIEYCSGKKVAAARALQLRGFQVLAVGTTISAQAPADLWSSTFGISFQSRAKQVAEGVSGSYLKPVTDHASIPEDLRGIVRCLLFMEPPQFFAP